MARETQGSPANEKKLEQYGVWVKVKPRDVKTAPVLEESFTLSDLESPRASARTETTVKESALTAEEEQLLDELETELEPETGGPRLAVPDEEPLLADAELPEIETASGQAGSADLEFEAASDEELPELEEDLEPALHTAPRSERSGGSLRGHADSSADVEVTLSEGLGHEDQFDDLAALEDELASVTTKTRDASTSSSEILARIEDELRSIRADLNQLRRDLSGLRKSAAEGVSEGSAAETGSQGGFFNEDDETIALTGDELDNILNTAEITEETAEARADATDVDILSEETSPPRSAADAPEADLEEVEEVEIAEEDLVLEELAPEEDTGTSEGEKGAAELPEIDLEGIPELEAEPANAPPLSESATDYEGSETIDLETLDLGEEPKVIEANPEQLDQLEELEDAEEVLEEKTPARGKSSPVAKSEPADEVDLEALAAEAEELEDNVPAAPVVEDLELGELESLSDEAGQPGSPQKEIEINFEGDMSGNLQALDESGGPDEAVPAEEIAEAEELPEAPPGGGTGIPDNLKDEIRTVLQYMDHLLEALPDDKIKEFAGSDYFVMYKKLFEDLGLGE